MKRSSRVQAAKVVFAFLVGLGVGIDASAAEIKVLSALGMRPVLEELGPKFEKATHHRLVITLGAAGAVLKRVQGGEFADLVILPEDGIHSVVKAGMANGSDATLIARSGIGVAVRKGAPVPDISSAEALKQALLAARSITYTTPGFGGESGNHFARVLDRLGIANDVKAKTVFPKTTGAVGEMVARGEAEIGVLQMQQFIPVEGIVIVGPLPGDLQNSIAFTGVIMTGSKEPEAARSLIEFLRTPAASTVIKAKGMEPATP
jgi:molybdate transport system substrate-binding protein